MLSKELITLFAKPWTPGERYRLGFNNSGAPNYLLLRPGATPPRGFAVKFFYQQNHLWNAHHAAPRFGLPPSSFGLGARPCLN